MWHKSFFFFFDICRFLRTMFVSHFREIGIWFRIQIVMDLYGRQLTEPILFTNTTSLIEIMRWYSLLKENSKKVLVLQSAENFIYFFFV